MSKELLKQLREMIGKTYQYREGQYTIIDVYLEEGYVKLETNNGLLKVTEKELTIFQDITNKVTVVETLPMAETLKTEFNSCNAIADIILDTVKKVQSDAKYVPQAKEINAGVKNLIDLKRLQVEMVSVFKK